MKSFPFTIISPRGKIYEQSVESISLRAYDGSLGVMANHAPMIAAVIPGDVKIRREGREENFEVAEGVVEVRPGGNTLLLVAKASIKV